MIWCHVSPCPQSFGDCDEHSTSRPLLGLEGSVSSPAVRWDADLSEGTRGLADPGQRAHGSKAGVR